MVGRLSGYIILIIWFGASHAVRAQNSFCNIMEEVYLHINEPDLIVGETMLFSAYVRSAATGKLSDLSRILYVEVLDYTGTPVHQAKISLKNGRGQGEYFLASGLGTGNYHLVAYTRWMKNFDQYYHQPFTVINPFESFKSISSSDKLEIAFFPEGGILKEGVRNRIGVYATSNEKGRSVVGRIMDSNGSKVADLSTDEWGIGSFTFAPQPGSEYQCIVEDESGNFKFFELPKACTECAQLSIIESTSTYLISTEGSGGVGKVIIRDQQNILLEKPIGFPDRVSVAKNDLKEGVLQVELWNDKEVLNKRLIFQEPSRAGGMVLERRKSIRDQMSVSVELPERATVSISVQSVNNERMQVSIGGIFSQVTATGISAYRGDRLEDLLLVLESLSEISNVDTVRFLPEHRSDLISGYLQNGKVGEESIAISLPGDDFQFHITRSDSLGNFLFGLMPFEQDRSTFFKVMDSDRSYDIIIENEFYDEYPEFANPPIDFDSARVQRIIDRSIQNQIQNAYYLYNPDSIASTAYSANQFENNRVYRLDDYTRFPTLRDTFIEYIPEIGVRKNESNYNINVRLRYLFSGERSPSLYLIDGLPISSRELFEVSPYAIEKINILNNRFFFGNETMDGIVSLETMEGDYAGINTRAFQSNTRGLDRTKIYSFPDHSQSSSFPDQREQLFWSPSWDVDGAFEFDFYTSDVPGLYEVQIEGVTESGRPVSLNQKFVVE